MLSKADQPRGRDAGGLIFRKMNNQKKESSRKLGNNEPYVAIDKSGYLRCREFTLRNQKGF